MTKNILFASKLKGLVTNINNNLVISRRLNANASPDVPKHLWKSLNSVRKHVFICSNPYIYTTVVQEVYNRDRSSEVDDVEGLAAAATKHLELLKQKDEAESSFIIKKIVGKLLNRTLDLFHFIYTLWDSNGWEFYLYSDPEETKPFKLFPRM